MVMLTLKKSIKMYTFFRQMNMQSSDYFVQESIS